MTQDEIKALLAEIGAAVLAAAELFADEAAEQEYFQTYAAGETWPG